MKGALVAKVEPVFVGVGCNVESSCMDWSADTGMVAFGAGHAVAIMCPRRNAVLATFDATSVVTKVRWLPGSRIVFASCSAGLVAIEFDDANAFESLETCRASVTITRVASDDGMQDARFHGLCVLRDGYGDGETMVVMTGSHLVAFQFTLATRACAQVGPALALVGRQLSECVAAAFLPHSKLVMVAVGAADNRVHLYVTDANCHAAAGRLGYVAWLEGHQDWVRDLCWCVDDGGDGGDNEDGIVLASCSHDHYVRLWRVLRFTDALAQHQQSAVQDAERRQRILFAVTDTQGNVPRFSVGLDALLIGHRHWVQSIRWHASTRALLSASMDKTVIVWGKDADEGVWLDRHRVGEIGGNSLGFYGAVFAPDGASVLAHSFNGSLHLWRRGGAGHFEALPTVSGHTGDVVDVSWDPHGRYLVSISDDETARLWCAGRERWFELARPQIHGHPLRAAVMVPGREHMLVTGAEEKAVRVFSATRAFVQSLENLTGHTTADDGNARPFGASQAPLGLSNKPLVTAADASKVEEARQEEAFAEELPRAAPEVLRDAPVETHLAQSTLWPEDRKLYAHGSELFALAASHDGTLVASACKGTAKPHTDVILWRTSDWSIAGRLSHHKMTVTRIVFSHSDRYVATVSRDWTLCLWERSAPGADYRLAWSKKKAHDRIIWDCCWAPDDSMLVTCSRDKRAICWTLDVALSTFEQGAVLKRSVALTCCAFYPCAVPSERFVLAVGTEEGALSLWTLDEVSRSKWKLLAEARLYGQPMKRLAFHHMASGSGSVMLASGGGDRTVRVHRVAITTHFSQLCALVLCVDTALGIALPKLVTGAIWSHLRK